MLMGSSNSSDRHNHQPPEEEQETEQYSTRTISDLQLYQHQSIEQSSTIGFTITTTTTPPPPNNVIQFRRLLISSAELLSHSDFNSAHRLLSILSSNSSPFGDSTERLVHHFSKALLLRLSNTITTSPLPSFLTTTIPAFASSSSSAVSLDIDQQALQSCYLTLNQVTPFIRFSHLTANQAILEAIDETHQSIHILDFDIMHGLQWPPFMQALAERHSFSHHNTTAIPPLPPMLRITATGNDLPLLHRTGERLSLFAQSLGLRFQFNPLLQSDLLPSAIDLLNPNEALAVNSVLYLHKHLKNDYRQLCLFLHKIKSLNPKVVTIAEREANFNHPIFLQGFVEALDHYTAIFESLEATMPPNSHERLEVEQKWLGREIMEAVAVEGEKRLRSERYESWKVMLRTSGFTNVALSSYALSQAKLLLRLHYPSEGYQLHILNDSFFLAWKNRPLFSVSSWH